MPLRYNRHKQLETRRFLRKNSTVAERMLWVKLKNKQLGARFRRQYGIGYYIADFCCPRKKLVIEIDGGIHENEDLRFYDQERQETIEELGFTVLRFTNGEVEKNIDTVILVVKKYL